MRSHRRILMLLCTLLLIPVLPGCSDNPTSTKKTDPLVAAWTVTSFMAMGHDFITEGMSLLVTLDETGGYSIQVTGDLVGICDGSPDCTDTGTYTSTTSRVTLDPGTEGETIFNYAIQGSVMSWSGDIDGNPATLTFTKL